MPEIVKFKAFCLEQYKFEHNLCGKETINLFMIYGVLDYISEYYDVLHSFGNQYIIQDIDLFIDARKHEQ